MYCKFLTYATVISKRRYNVTSHIYYDLILRSEHHYETAAGLHGNGDGGPVTGDG